MDAGDGRGTGGGKDAVNEKTDKRKKRKIRWKIETQGCWRREMINKRKEGR